MASYFPEPCARIHEELHSLRLARPDSREAWEFLRSWPLDAGHEAPLALMAATILENALENAIATHFAVNREEAESIFIDQAEGSLSAFSVKIKLAYVLGVIEKKVRKELTLIKTIRNLFVHAPLGVSFSSEGVATYCNHLFIWKEVPAGADGKPETAKQKYANSIDYIFAYLNGSVTKETERVPLLCDDSNFYLVAFLSQENYPSKFGASRSSG
jgi:DNA-binding MltR family transcriptional regulator